MSELALELIREARKNQSTRLDLRNCGLVELPNELFQLNFLEEIYLSNNKIQNISSIEKLTKINTLHIEYNIINDISPLAELKNIFSLKLSGNKISDISSLENFYSLKSLDLRHNKITNLDPIKELYNLNRLTVFNNEITSIDSLANLINLNSVNITHNFIEDLSPLESLVNLRRISFAVNSVKDITTLSSLKRLNRINANRNIIENIQPLLHLKNLSEIDLSENRIIDISPLSHIRNLASLRLSHNKIKNLYPLARLIEKGIPLALEDSSFFEGKIIISQNPIKIPPLEIIAQGNERALQYLKNIKTQGSKKINEAKLIIVGEPNAGKTTLMETLIDPTFKLTEKTESTLGIEVRENWQFPHPKKPETTFTTNIWDFGGQQIQYMTHQFFLTPGAAYVLVSTNDRKEPTNFPYWFKIIHLLGEEQGRFSPVIVVLNEKDDKFINKFNFDKKFYEERYPELKIIVCEVDLSKRDGQYLAMREQIQKALCNLPHVTDPRPARWKDIRESLREHAKTADHTSFDEYAAICSQHEVTEEDSQLLFSGYLHRLGSLLHFSDDPTLHNFIILNPQWAVDAVYSVLNDNQVAKDDGYFSRAQVEAIWKDKYNFDERCKLLNLMQKENFEICYPMDRDSQWFIAPQLLNAEQPDFVWDGTANLRFRFQYKFMPEGILTRLIVRLNEILAHGEGNKQLIWRKGAIFVERGCRAHVEEEENRAGLKIIDIAINGKVSEQKFLLRRIRDEVSSIHRKWFRNIRSEEMIPCSCEICAAATEPTFFEFSELQQYKEEGEQNIVCRNGHIKRVPVLQLLEGVFPADELQPPSATPLNLTPIQADIDIFLSYSRKNKLHAAQLVKLLESRGYQVWWDKDLAAGDRFRGEIKEKLVAANCVVVLWSEAAIKSDWVPEEAGYAHTEKKLAPAMLEPVELPLPFTGSHAANLSNWLGEEQDPNLQQLLDGIAKLTRQ